MTISAGVVKWFGGYNKKTETNNKYGFILDTSGSDVFLHVKEWNEKSPPKEDEVITYFLEKNGNKWAAKGAKYLNRDEGEFNRLDLLMGICISSESLSLKKRTDDKLKKMFSVEFSLSPPEDKVRCIEKLGKKALLLLLADREQWLENLSDLENLELVEPIVDISWESLPQSYFFENEDVVAEHLLKIDLDKARQKSLPELRKFSPALILLTILSGVFRDLVELRDEEERVRSYIESIYLDNEKIPKYLNDYIDSSVRPKGGVIKDPVVGYLFEFYLFKKYLYEKNIKFVALYESSHYLQSRLDIFVLVKLFSLILSGNSITQVYTLFMNQMWEGITKGIINPKEQQDQMHQLFPSCSTTPRNLSCEAVYWPKQNIYLCRGRKCNNPKVIPNMSRTYHNYTAYDWFSHYGIAYLDERVPSSRDFPIKLAAYLNRLQEIYDVIHCRRCHMLMLPDMRYSRVEYTTFENGAFVKKSMAASYRLTVFKCPNQQCPECDIGYYINHCIGFDCFNIIDARDCKVKCDSGRYVCKGCGSCCGEHSNSQSAGLCPECGSALNLFQSKDYDSQQKRYKRFVECSSEQCGFGIASENLSKRFYLDSCGQPIQGTY